MINQKKDENRILYLMGREKELEYNLELFIRLDSLVIKVDSDQTFPFEHYEGIFTLNNLHTIKFFESLSIEDIINKLSTLIDEKEIKILRCDAFIKLCYKDVFSLQIDEIRKTLNQRMEEIYDYMHILAEKVNSLEKENKNLRNEIVYLKKRMTENELKHSIKIINRNSDFNKKVEKKLTSEIINLNEKIFNIHIKNFSISLLQSYTEHTETVNYISVFQNGNFITASSDYSIKLFDLNKPKIFSIDKAHSSAINSIDTKDNNKFISCSQDGIIKIWFINDEEFTQVQMIENAHKSSINCIKYFKDSERLNQFISSSNDKTMKIWEKSKDNRYYCIKTILNTDSNYINCIIELDETILTGGYDGIKIWDLKNYDLTTSIINCSCYSENTLKMIDKDRFIISSGNEKSIFIGSINEEKLIVELSSYTEIYAILIIQKGFFLTAGKDKNIRLYRSDNYDIFKAFKTEHSNEINGFFFITDNIIGSYSKGGQIKLWNC